MAAGLLAGLPGRASHTHGAVRVRVQIWTDGSSTGRVGDGGWAYLMRYGMHEKQESGFATDTTNNRMEMTAALMALRALKRPMPVTIFTDSEYLMHAFTQGWLQKWERKRWRKVKNVDLWKALQVEVRKHNVEWQWLRGHAGHAENETVDKAAVAARHAGAAAYVHVELDPAQESLV